jgi:glycosyltransferase involved in cell wall biosynthesis
MNHPRVSVVLPVYNAAHTLDAAIDSLLSQTEQSLQLVIVDDGSTDRSATLIRKWAAKDERVYPVFAKHKGIVAALNTGLSKATAPYIARMDADDISMPQRLQKQADFLDANPDFGLVSCLVKHLGNKETQTGYAHYVSWVNSLTTNKEITRNRFIESPLAHPSVMFRKQLIHKFGEYRNGVFPEDYELWLRWLEQGVRMGKIPEPLLKWRDHPDRLSRIHHRYSTDAFYQLKARYLAKWLTKHNPMHPNVVIWGAGRSSRKRAELLTDYGVNITHYIDVNPNKIGQKIHGRLVWSPDDIPSPNEAFIVSYVGNRGVNKKISAHLNTKNFKLGKHFIFAA